MRWLSQTRGFRTSTDTFHASTRRTHRVVAHDGRNEPSPHCVVGRVKCSRIYGKLPAVLLYPATVPPPRLERSNPGSYSTTPTRIMTLTFSHDRVSAIGIIKHVVRLSVDDYTPKDDQHTSVMRAIGSVLRPTSVQIGFDSDVPSPPPPRPR
ncbi:unnamed protein product [Ectocarpus sp. 8 AP-2014]